jgi:hypothetical protein
LNGPPSQTLPNTVGRDLDEAEILPPAAVQPRPVSQRRLQEDKAAAHVVVTKISGLSIERSTWLSAAKWSMTSGSKSSNAVSISAHAIPDAEFEGAGGNAVLLSQRGQEGTDPGIR